MRANNADVSWCDRSAEAAIADDPTPEAAADQTARLHRCISNGGARAAGTVALAFRADCGTGDHFAIASRFPIFRQWPPCCGCGRSVLSIMDSFEWEMLMMFNFEMVRKCVFSICNLIDCAVAYNYEIFIAFPIEVFEYIFEIIYSEFNY